MMGLEEEFFDDYKVKISNVLVEKIKNQEVILEKKIIFWENDDLISLLVLMKNRNQIQQIINTLKKYNEWLIAKGKNGLYFNFNEIKISQILLQLKTDDYISPNEYTNILHKFDNIINDDFSYHYYKCMFMCIYEGILGDKCKDIMYLSYSQIKANNITLLSGKIVNVSDDLIKEINILKNITDIKVHRYRIDLTELFSDSVFKYMIKDSTILESSIDEKELRAYRKIIEYMSKTVSKMLEINVTTEIIYRSGLVNYTCNKYGTDLTFNDVAKAIDEYGANIDPRTFKFFYQQYIKEYRKEK